jgi:hypothetical protein
MLSESKFFLFLFLLADQSFKADCGNKRGLLYVHINFCYS